ncbi:zeta toxin family protein [Neisseria animalis]|uniref:Zeta toxin domain-containing protein n=1 Tax=Neisseria animalis TaxID=492 RepID=A0A5P3MRW6_NEIAN|nr:zeta toxin family protein [Neisseria animalis]QEY24343.1 hypothetical protein D0T90_07480 [Neisseria animalis]ROW31750.1 hypothetical protein CGZ60_08805 [Neisseria animalis]VEE06828.1 Uncharacterized protein conserved in bacteria [Neisseria animalis]
MPNNLAIFYCGINGAGKSTLRTFNHDAVEIVIDSDHIATQIKPAHPRLADMEAGRKAISLFQFAIQQHLSFSMESTLSGRSILQRMKAAHENGFHVRLNDVAVDDAAINLARMAARAKAGGHFIDSNTVRRRFQTASKHLLQALPLCHEVFVYDNSYEQPNLIFWLTKSRITQLSEKLPAWGVQLQTDLLRLGY